jgi:hypothetical protein
MLKNKAIPEAQRMNDPAGHPPGNGVKACLEPNGIEFNEEWRSI